MAGVGYQRRGATSHRKYNRASSIAHYKRTGSFRRVATGMGHAAGESWAAAKEIDPMSRVRKYSKNSPSFDEGVYQYKMKKRQEIAGKMK